MKNIFDQDLFEKLTAEDVREWYAENRSRQALADVMELLYREITYTKDNLYDYEEITPEYEHALKLYGDWKELYDAMENEILLIMNRKEDKDTDDIINAFMKEMGYRFMYGRWYRETDLENSGEMVSVESHKLTYYFIYTTEQIAKGYQWHHWIYTRGKWEKDTSSKVMALLNGYDPYEPDGSPYGFGSASVMDEITVISYTAAMEYIAWDRIERLMEKWKKEFRKQKEEWNHTPSDPAKQTQISFIMFNRVYIIKAEDLGFTDDFMEIIIKKMEEDLKKAGAEEISSSGFMD